MAICYATDEKATEYNLYERTGCSGETLAHKGGFSSVEQCQAWCEARNWQGCGAFVYSPGRNRCYLKRDCNDRKIEPENVSGVKLAGGRLPRSKLNVFSKSISASKSASSRKLRGTG